MVKTSKLSYPLFIFGYGSLMSDSSRKRTLKNHVKAFPARINKKFGYKKTFNTIASRRNNEIVLGIEKNSKNTTSIYGVLFPVKKRQLAFLNDREKVYKRLKVPSSYIKTTTPIPKKSTIITYKPMKIYKKFKKSQRIYKGYKKVVNNATKKLYKINKLY